ncbi:MAG: hypothetical protein Greene041614_707 [Parcubacteria group bacterium Greene0416_14]|nr:MAG: hypothetical protein Greene041614_707 [Parcubacteria group bacterium Greene0416_14]TSD08147.1 MAG: hypothetical protein Greene07144_382 [Parcubacteria group bacterium Greene0714_4]
MAHAIPSDVRQFYAAWGGDNPLTQIGRIAAWNWDGSVYRITRYGHVITRRYVYVGMELRQRCLTFRFFTARREIAQAQEEWEDAADGPTRSALRTRCLALQ